MVDVRVLWLVKFNTLLLMVDVRVLWHVRLNTLIIMMQVLLIICQEVHRPPYFMESQLRQWPVQIKLAPLSAPYFQNANLLIAADCTAYAYGNFHNQFIKNHVVLIGCPKLDAVDYTEKLTEIIKHNDFKSLTIVRMEVPCCGGLEHAATEALKSKREVYSLAGGDDWD